MKKILSLIIVAIVFQSCGVLFMRRVKCREYKVDTEKFWFQGKVNSKYTLINNKSKEEKIFVLKDKWISTRDEYFSDTGCDCHNASSQLLATATDSIWTKNDSRYVERGSPKVLEAYTFKFGPQKWIFNNETSSMKNEIKIINGKEINVKTYTEEYDGTEYILVVGEGIGVISVQLNNDEQWERKSLEIEEIAPVINYRTMKNFCN